MAIEAQLPNGTTLQFPDGTPDAVVNATVKNHISALPGGKMETPESKLGFQPAPPKEEPPPPPAATDYADVPGGGSLPDVQPQPGSASAGQAWSHINPAVARIGQAAVEGYQEATQPPATPGKVAVPLESTIGGNFLVSPVNKLFGAAVGALSGLGRAGMQGAYEVGNAIGGPQLGRDFVFGSQSIVPDMSLVPRPTPAARPTPPRFAGEYRDSGEALPGTTSLDRLTSAIGRADQQPPRPPRGVPEQEAGVPSSTEARPAAEAQPVGAQITPASEIGLTPAEEAAYRSTAEGNKLLEPQEPGVRDDKVYLTGERINAAEASQDVEVARELKSLREQTPELDKKMTADESHNNNIRYNAIQTTLPGQVQITAEKAARTKAMEDASPAVFRGATDANLQPIVQEMEKILNEPENRQNSQLQQYLRPLVNRLVNPDGTQKFVDPKELLSWRHDVQHLTSGAATRADPNLSRISGLLGKVLDVTDNQIEASAPGYKERMRDEYRERSRKIDAMEALNAERTKLFDSQNVPNYNALQNMLKRIYNARMDNDPYEPFTHVPQETLDKLYDIRDSMRRSRAADNLGKPRGSPTSQNLGDALRAAGSMAVKSSLPVLGAGVGHLLVPLPFAGEAAGMFVGQAANHLLSQRGMRQRLQRGLELTTPNPLYNPAPGP